MSMIPPDALKQFASRDPRDYRATCPVCSPTRKHKHETCLSITVTTDGSVLAYCHHCQAKGSYHDRPSNQRPGRSVAEVTGNKLRNRHAFRDLDRITSRW